MSILGEDDIAPILDCSKIVSFAHEARKRGKPCGCLHQSFVIDERHGSVECSECEEPVSAFHALCAIAREETRFRRQMASLTIQRDELKKYKPWLIAVRTLERMWRGKRALPCCPHCNRGIYAEELTQRSCGIQIEEQRRTRNNRE